MRSKGFINILLAGIIGAVIVAGLGFFVISKQPIQPTVFSPKIQSGLLGTQTGSGLFPTSTNNFSDGDIINSSDWNAIEEWLGIRNATNTDSISFKLIATSSTDPGHVHTSTAVSGTIAVAKGGTATTTFIRGLVIASGTDAFGTLAPIATGQLVMASGTQSVFGNLVAGSNITITTSTVGQITLASGSKFGGTGADGALSITAGTTTIALGGAPLFVKNYTSISITGGALAFSGTSTVGHIIVLKSQGDCTFTSASTTMIDLRQIGSLGGVGGANGGTGAGGGGGGGASTINDGNSSGAGTFAGGTAGTVGSAYGQWLFSEITAGAGGSISAVVAGGLNPHGSSTLPQYVKLAFMPGSGGGGGAGGNTGSGLRGGAGGGALWIECGGALNFTGTIDASGQIGRAGDAGNAGNSGSGGGGSVVILYTTLTNNAGTITTTGGTSQTGTTGGAGGAGGNGFSLVNINTEF